MQTRLQFILTQDLGQGLDAGLLDLFLGHEDDGTSSIVQGRSVGGGDTSVLLEDRSKGSDLVKEDLLVFLVLLDNGVALLALDSNRSNLGIELAFRPSSGHSLVGFYGVIILRLSSDSVFLGSVFSTVAHGALVVNVEQPIDHERVVRGHVAERWGVSRRQERSLAHALHSTGDHTRVGTQGHRLSGKHDGLHTRGANFVDRGGIRSVGNAIETPKREHLLSRCHHERDPPPNSPRANRYLSSGVLTDSSLDDLPKVELVDILGVQVDLVQSMLDGCDSKFSGGKRRQGTVKGTNGRSRGSDDVDGSVLGDGA